MPLSRILVPKRSRLQYAGCRRIKVAVTSFLKNKRLPLYFPLRSAWVFPPTRCTLGTIVAPPATAERPRSVASGRAGVRSTLSRVDPAERWTQVSLTIMFGMRPAVIFYRSNTHYIHTRNISCIPPHLSPRLPILPRSCDPVPCCRLFFSSSPGSAPAFPSGLLRLSRRYISSTCPMPSDRERTRLGPSPSERPPPILLDLPASSWVNRVNLSS
jgi:hypothetical protein